MGLIDIIVLVIVALAVVTRFTKFKLPRDTRTKTVRKQDWLRLRHSLLPSEEQPDPQQPQGAPKLAGKGRVEKVPGMPGKPAAKVKAAKPVPTMKELAGMSGLEQIKALEPGFSEKDFVARAKEAYAAFTKRWNAKDEDGLRQMCAPVLAGRMVNQWDEGAWHARQPDTLDEVTIAKARVHGRTAIIDADFKVTVKGKRGASRSVVHRWVLARPLNSDDPTWEIQDMHTGVDA